MSYWSLSIVLITSSLEKEWNILIGMPLTKIFAICSKKYSDVPNELSEYDWFLPRSIDREISLGEVMRL